MLELANDPIEAGDVRRARTPDGAEVWLVSRYAQVRAALADPVLSLDKRNARDGYRGFALPPALDANLLNMDPPDHTRLRSLVSAAFTRQRVAEMRPAVEREAERLLTAVRGRDTVDLMAAYAAPLPMTVIGDLLGVAAEDREAFRAWTDTLIAPDPARPDAARDAMRGMVGLLTRLVAEKRAAPAGDLLSALAAEPTPSADELLSLAFLLLWAGYENSVHVIGNALAYLLTHDDRPAPPDLLALADPNRYAIRRFPLRDTEIGGITIPAGDTVLLSIAAANRDPARAGAAHLSLGYGPHHCLGAPLARLELDVAVAAFGRHLPHAELAVPVGELRWRPSFRSHGLLALPITPGP
ncbi:MAG TPA: cytochrome P450 [Actinocatenispora sp.]